MLRFLILEILLPLLVVVLIRSIIKSLMGAVSPRPSQPKRGTPPPVPAGGELKRDPVCGTYVSAATSLSRTVSGETVYFCSKECRDRFRG